jgi:hypothetical protein
MSPQYKCKDCGYEWQAIKLKKTDYQGFLRHPRCESKNHSHKSGFRQFLSGMDWS